jgi:hypothetical protein
MVLDAVIVGRWRYYRTPRPTLPPLAHRIFNYTNTKITQADIGIIGMDGGSQHTAQPPGRNPKWRPLSA